VPPTVTVPLEVDEPATAPGPDQEYETGVIVVEAETPAFKFIQVIDPVFEAVTTGIPVLGTTLTVPELKHPLIGFVTVNVYVFGEQAEAEYVLAPPQTPPVQTGVQEDGPAEPANVTVGDKHVIVCVLGIVTVGVVVF
jgi:hypothetical protein